MAEKEHHYNLKHKVRKCSQVPTLKKEQTVTERSTAWMPDVGKRPLVSVSGSRVNTQPSDYLTYGRHNVNAALDPAIK